MIAGDAVAQCEERLPRTSQIVRAGLQRRLHNGFQLYVSLDGAVVADCGIGEASPDVPMDADTLNVWLSSGKPVTAVALARLWEQSRVGLDDPVARHIPEFAGQGKQGVTIRHLLTHTAGLRHVETGWPDVSWDETLRRICAAPLEPDWQPGQRAGYHVASSWFLLGEIVARLSGSPFPHALRESVFEPLEMHDSWAALQEDVHAGYGDRIGWMYAREQGELVPLDWHSPQRCAAASPGGSLRGPIRELGRFYEMLLSGGTQAGTRLLTPQTVEALTARHRTGRHDETFQHVVDFGLGFIIDSNLYGADTVPYGYGRYCSPRTFGHGGAQSSIAFADPEQRLVVAWLANGRAGEGQHNRRSRELNEALYHDLGLA